MKAAEPEATMGVVVVGGKKEKRAMRTEAEELERCPKGLLGCPITGALDPTAYEVSSLSPFP